MRLDRVHVLAGPGALPIFLSAFYLLTACDESGSMSQREAESLRRLAQQPAPPPARTPVTREPQPVSPTIRQPATAIQQPAGPASSGWLSGDQAREEMRRLSAERQRVAPERRTFEGQPATALPSQNQSAAAQRRAAGLASYADCNLAESRVRTIKNAQKSGAKVYALSVETGIRNVDKSEAAKILAESERFIAEKCRR